MGVSGLWEILEGTSQSIPITQLSLTAFHSTPHRTLRIGIDASLWTFHATHQSTNAGLNPFLRVLFFKILKLLHHPILLVFVFDGPEKPGMKRGVKVAGRFGTGDQASRKFKGLLDDMGIEYWTAPGEAEAELARLSQQDKIDAVLTDDVDALLFGATKILRNTSRTLSSNNRLTYDNVEDFQVYTLSTITAGNSVSTFRDARSRAGLISRSDRAGGRGTSSSSSLTSLDSRSSSEEEQSEDEEEEEEVIIQTPRQRSKATLTQTQTQTQKGKSKPDKNGRWNGLSVEGMIFVALCSGGDYHPAGIPSCGPKIAYGLAQTPLATDLIHAFRTLSSKEFQTYLIEFRLKLKEELSTNSLGFLPNKRKQLAQTLPSTFPQVEIIDYYVNPRVSSGEDAWPGFGKREPGSPGAGQRGGRGDPRCFALVCEKYFEWGTKDEVARRMKTLVWRGEVISQLREKLFEQEASSSVASTSRPLKDAKIATYFRSVASSQSSLPQTHKGKSRALGPTSSSSSLASDEFQLEPFPRARLITIHSKRQHASTGLILEYRVEYDPRVWTRTIQAVMKGTRVDPSLLSEQERVALGLTSGRETAGERAGSVASSTGEDESADHSDDAMDRTPRKAAKKDVDANERIWMPAALVVAGWPELVMAYETRLREKAEKAALKTPRRTKKTVDVAKTVRSRPSPVKAPHRMQGWTSDEDEPADGTSPSNLSPMQRWLNSGNTIRNTSSAAPTPTVPAGRTRAVRIASTLPSDPITVRSSSPPMALSSRRGSRPPSSSASSTSGDEWGTPRRLFDQPKTPRRRPAHASPALVRGATPRTAALVADDEATPIARPKKTAARAPIKVIEISSSSDEDVRPRVAPLRTLRLAVPSREAEEAEEAEEEEEEEITMIFDEEEEEEEEEVVFSSTMSTTIPRDPTTHGNMTIDRSDDNDTNDKHDLINDDKDDRGETSRDIATSARPVRLDLAPVFPSRPSNPSGPPKPTNRGNSTAPSSTKNTIRGYFKPTSERGSSQSTAYDHDKHGPSHPNALNMKTVAMQTMTTLKTNHRAQVGHSTQTASLTSTTRKVMSTSTSTSTTTSTMTSTSTSTSISTSTTTAYKALTKTQAYILDRIEDDVEYYRLGTVGETAGTRLRGMIDEERVKL